MKRFLESELPQGSQEWLALRKGHITATMASVVSGTNPFQNPDKLWKEILGLIPPKEANFAMERGKRLESVARRRYEELTGEIFEQMCIVSELELDSDGKHWIMASLDGMDAFGLKGIEIKCPSLKTHQMALQGQIPNYYEDQIQWQFLASENKMASIDYVSFNPDVEPSKQLAIVPVLPDIARQQELLSLCKTFRLCIKNKVPPCGSEFESAAIMFVIADKELDDAKNKHDEAKKLVIQAANGKPQNGSGVIVSVSERKGTVSMDDVIKTLMAEFNIPEQRVDELKVLHTGNTKSVTAVKAANDAKSVYLKAITDRDEALKCGISSVQNIEQARAEDSAVSPTW